MKRTGGTLYHSSLALFFRISIFFVCFQYFTCIVLPTFHVGASKINVTVDDAYPGDATTKIEYIPADMWNIGQTCTGCHVRPNASLTNNGSWHDVTADAGISTEQRSIRISFFGTAIYIYCILANTLPGTATLANYTFTLDGDPAGHYLHAPENTSDYQYNVLVFSNDTMENATHTFEMDVVTGSGLAGAGLAVFDYFVYTQSFADPVQKKSSNIGAIVGGVIGGLVGVLLLLLGLLQLWRWRRSQSDDAVQIGAGTGPALVSEPTTPVRQMSMADSNALGWLHGGHSPSVYSQGSHQRVGSVAASAGAGSLAAGESEALQQRVAELERMVERLATAGGSSTGSRSDPNSSRDALHVAPVTPPPHQQSHHKILRDNSAMQQQIRNLQDEIERLRAGQGGNHDRRGRPFSDQELPDYHSATMGSRQ